MAISLRQFLLENEVGRKESGEAIVPPQGWEVDPKKAARLVVSNYLKQGRLEKDYVFSAHPNFKVKIVHFDLPHLRELVRRYKKEYKDKNSVTALEDVWKQIYEKFFTEGRIKIIEDTLQMGTREIVELVPSKKDDWEIEYCPVQMKGIARWGVANLNTMKLSAALKNKIKVVLANKLVQLFNEGIFVNIFVSRSEAKRESFNELLNKYRKAFDVFVSEIIEQAPENFEVMLEENYPKKESQSQGYSFLSRFLYPSFMWITKGLDRIHISPLHKVLVNFNYNRKDNERKIAAVIADEFVIPSLRFVSLLKEVSEISDAGAKFREVVSRIIEDRDAVNTLAYLLVDYLKKVYFRLEEWLAEFLKEILRLIKDNGINLIIALWNNE
jgi:hypothetical protein